MSSLSKVQYLDFERTKSSSTSALNSPLLQHTDEILMIYRFYCWHNPQNWNQPPLTVRLSITITSTY